MLDTRAVGQRVRRIDSPPKLTGQERFTSDLRVPGMLVARPVTSPYAHARIRGIDTARALEIPGVVRVLSSDDLPIARDSAGAPVKAPIASGEAVYAGQFVALVLAESDAAAQDGVAAVDVDYEPLPVITTLDEALDPSSPHIRETRQQANDEEAAMHNADAATQAEENDELDAAANAAPDCPISVKLGATKAGGITALESRLVFDTGSSGGSPLQIAAILLGGYYRFPNLEIRGHEVLTNKPGAGAYRAPGAQQATFAIESAVDELARKLDLDPLAFRLQNCA